MCACEWNMKDLKFDGAHKNNNDTLESLRAQYPEYEDLEYDPTYIF